MEKDKPSQKKVKPKNPESKIDSIQRLYQVLTKDIARLKKRFQDLDTLITETSRKQKLIFLLNLFVSGGKVILILAEGFLRFPFLLPTQEDKENILKGLMKSRFSAWMFNVILQHTPDSPWEKIDKYLIPALEKSETNLQESEDIMAFYFLDRLGILEGEAKKDKFWELAKNYLEKNVFEKVYEGEEPPEVKTITESIGRKCKRLRSKEQSVFSVHGIDLEEEKIPPQDLAFLKIISKENLSEEHIDLATKREQARKLREAINLLTPKQKEVIQLK